MSKTWKENLKSESFWLRTIFIVLFLIVYRIVDLIVLLVALSQWLYTLITGDSNTSLGRFASSLGLYVKQIINYLSYNSDEKPYPFSDWPEAEVVAKSEPAESSASAEDEKEQAKDNAKAQDESSA